ncbi:MAG TPA: hypothetical protein VK447_17775 [Myxococcaceae bacterium]|nr:hypothetical protein [Myxococcaceae bacterium]
MPGTSRNSAPGLLLAVALVTVASGACLNFDEAYGVYCADSGLCDGGTGTGDGGRDGGRDGGDGGGTDGGGIDGGGTDGGADGGETDGGQTDAGQPDAGRPDAGQPDAGTTPCLTFGSACTAYGQCCDPDPNNGRPMGCSRLGYCQPRPPECHEDGYRCSQATDCCSGKCNNGVCSACSDGNSGNLCSQAVDCCVHFSSVCNSGGNCEGGTVGSAPNNYHCASSDFCGSGYCELVSSGQPPTGFCKAPANNCVTVRQTTSGTCCPGLERNATSGACCLPNESYCYYDSSCCSGNCSGGRCKPAGAGGALGNRCLSSPECGGQLLCDPVSRTCTGRWCMRAPLPYPGCCTFSQWNGQCSFTDGRTCGNPGATCTAGSQCCSGTCQQTGNTMTCGAIQFFQ